MNESDLSILDALKLRSQLHIRAGKKLLDHNKIAHAIGTLFDAIEHAMRRKYMIMEGIKDDTKLGSNQEIYQYLREQAILSSAAFDFEELEDLMEASLDDNFDLDQFNITQFWERFKLSLTELDVFPFDPDDLPKEDNRTREILGLEDITKDPQY